MERHDIRNLLTLLDSPDAATAWTAFLHEYAPVLRQVITLMTADDDEQADCFVFICEQLASKGFNRLRKFDASGPASFATWLRAVARNLCIDWKRKTCGRFQPFSWTEGLDALDRQVFRCVYEQGCTVEHTFSCLAPASPGLTLDAVEQSAARIAGRLSSRERWLLASRRVRVESLDAEPAEERQYINIPDLAPDPERAVIDGEYQRALAKAVAALPSSDQLLLRLRFEQELTLAEIARLTKSKDAQTVDRKIRAILDQVRTQLRGFEPLPAGKARAASV